MGNREASNGKLDLDLRRGVLVLTVLSQLRTAQYGYSLRQALAERGHADRGRHALSPAPSP